MGRAMDVVQLQQPFFGGSGVVVARQKTAAEGLELQRQSGVGTVGDILEVHAFLPGQLMHQPQVDPR
ncbi:hypothetical protein D3C81_2185430 [compost metagenome]